MTRLSLVLASFLVLLAAGCGSGDEGYPVVDVDVVERQSLRAEVVGDGEIGASDRVSVTADVAGRVVEVAVAEGDRVAEGDVLVRLDPTRFSAEVARARAALRESRARASEGQAALAQAEREAARYRGLADRGLVPEAEAERLESEAARARALLGTSRAGIAQAQATLREAQGQLAKTTIRAPMGGVVVELAIGEGETAVVGTMNNPGSLLLSIADLSRMEARVRVGEAQIARVAVGDIARVETAAYPDAGLLGRVTRIANTAADTDGADGPLEYEVAVLLDDTDLRLRSGMSCAARIEVAYRDDVVAVPIAALTTVASDSTEAMDAVVLVDKGLAMVAPVELGVLSGQRVEVLRGVAVGDSVVVGPADVIRDLRSGDPVSY